MIDADDPRVRMAAERTLLAWIRTALAVMGLGFVVARHGIPGLESRLIGLAMTLIGTVSITLAAREYARQFRVLADAAQAEFKSTTISVWFALALAVVGVVLSSSILLHSTPP